MLSAVIIVFSVHLILSTLLGISHLLSGSGVPWMEAKTGLRHPEKVSLSPE